MSVYRLNRTWRYWLIGPAIGLIFVYLVPSLLWGKVNDIPAILCGGLLIVGILGLSTYIAQTSWISTSPEGIEQAYFGIRVKAIWGQVERLDLNPFGVLSLVFKGSIATPGLHGSFIRFMGMDRSITLSPYLGPSFQSGLLDEISLYMPDLKIPELISQRKPSIGKSQTVGMIMLYYFSWFLGAFLITSLLGYGTDAWDLPILGLLGYMIGISLTLGLLIHGLTLAVYHGDLLLLEPAEIARKARNYYLYPLITVLLAILMGIAIWFVLQALTIRLTKDDYGIFSLAAFLVAAISPRVSRMIERKIFCSNNENYHFS